MIETTHIKSIETLKFNISLIEEDLIRIDVKPNVNVNKEDLDDNFKHYSNFLENKPALFLIVFGNNVTATEEARTELASYERDEIKIAEAAVIPSKITQIVAQLFMTFHKPQHPLRIFSKEEEAISWLLSHRISE